MDVSTDKLSSLCGNCRVLEFDDKEAGGREEISSSGDSYLSGMPMHPEGPGGWRLELEFRVSDTFPELPHLTRSALSGCDFCGLLKHSILHESEAKQLEALRININLAYSWWRAEEFANSKSEDLSTDPDTGMILCAEIQWTDNAGKNCDSHIAFRVEGTDAHDPVSKWLRINSQSPKNRLDPMSIAWSRARIKDCKEKHNHSAIRTTPFCPKRLLDVQSDPTRLVLGSDVAMTEPTPKYAALSYCWGSYQAAQEQLKTEPDTVSARMAGISNEEMTNVVRDAVAVTRSLSIPYLWIDALCILQGPEARLDWEEQAGLMHKIYGNAHVTIGALSSSSCLEGFIHIQERDMMVRYKSTVNPPVQGRIRIRPLKDQDNWTTEYILRANMQEDDITWCSRGWTFQEFRMASRFLAFGPSDLCFSCPVGAVFMDDLSGSVPLSDLKQLGLRWESSSKEDGIIEWYELVQEYSKRNAGFTNRSDIFPALSGLASLLSSSLNIHQDSYIAGHWTKNGDDHLLLSLTWVKTVQENEVMRSETITEYIETLQSSSRLGFPSWSWANSGWVIFPRIWRLRAEEGWKLSPHCAVECSATRESLPPFAAASNCLLRLKAPAATLPMDLIRDIKNPWNPSGWFLEDETDCFISLDWSPLEAVENNRLARDKLHVHAILTGVLQAPPPTVYDIGAGEYSQVWYGLIIHEAGPSYPGKFLRVGQFSLQIRNPELDEDAFGRAFKGWKEMAVDII
ncbi:heterokaryon incompatibility protein-domain-containing protein [Cladorrhinum sp. PSN259]|nr:heterokaryon incompatibility protein-domain-containing protein [Cladorrhinum sp. PSN259]